HDSLPELPDACGAAEPGRAAHHAVVQCHSVAARFAGLCAQVQRLSIEKELLCRAGIEDGGDSHAAGGTNGDQAAAGALLRQELRERRNDSRAGGRERVTDGHAAALDVELRSIDRAERAVAPEPLAAELLRLPRLERDERLRGERLVDLVEVEVL